MPREHPVKQALDTVKKLTVRRRIDAAGATDTQREERMKEGGLGVRHHPQPTDKGGIYRLRLTSSCNISSEVVITREFA
jgi:hypothetical protein